jgi:hypothetical protein
VAVSIFTHGAGKLMCVGLCVCVGIVAVSIFTQGAGKLMCVCLCVCEGGDSGYINFYTGCRKTSVSVSMCLCRWG